MNIEFKETYNPKPNGIIIKDREDYWKVKLPSSYFQFLIKYNGGVPIKRTFNYKNYKYIVVTFLCVLDDFEYNEAGEFDIDVVLTQLDERLIDNEELYEYELIPIAELTGYDYVCLDFRKNPETPCVCVWDSLNSGEFEPVTYKVADSFEDFIAMLE